MSHPRTQDEMEQGRWERALGYRQPHPKTSDPRCRGCHRMIYDSRDIAFGMCRNCHRPHSSPSCAAGLCGDANILMRKPTRFRELQAQPVCLNITTHRIEPSYNFEGEEEFQ